MKMAVLTASVALLAVCLVACRRSASVTTSAAAQPLPRVTPVTVKSQKLDTTVRLPAELTPYEAVDLYAKETGFVKTIKVDRGSRVKEGELIAELEAPELVAERARSNAAYQGAESQLAAGQAKLAADQATYQRTKAAAKVPGVVAANDVDIAQKTAQSDEANVAALQKTAEAAEESLRAVRQLESYLSITAPFDGQITTRYVHPGALVGPAAGAGAMTPIVRVETLGGRFLYAIRVYHRFRGEHSALPSPGSRTGWTSRRERCPWSWISETPRRSWSQAPSARLNGQYTGRIVHCLFRSPRWPATSNEPS